MQETIKSRTAPKNFWMKLLVMAYVIVAVLLSTACNGGNAPPDQVQITFGSNRVEFVTLYDAMAWLNGHESEGGTSGTRAYNNYLWQWAQANGQTQWINGRQPHGEFQITIMAQSGVDGASPQNFNGQTGVTDVASVANGIKKLLAESNPEAEVTMATSGGFNLNLRPSGADTQALNVGYGSLILDSMNLESAHNLFANGNDITIESGFSNSGRISIYAGTENTDSATAPGNANGVTDLVVKSSAARLTDLSGGNGTGGTFSGRVNINVQAASSITNVFGSGAGTGTPSTIQTADITINIRGGTITNVAGFGRAATVTSNAITNIYGGTITYVNGGAYAGTTVNAVDGAIELNVMGGTIRSAVFGTQNQNNTSSQYNSVKVNIHGGDRFADHASEITSALQLPITVGGNYSAHVRALEMYVGCGEGETTDFSRVNTWYVGNQSGTEAPDEVQLEVDAPDSNFGTMILVNSGDLGNPPRAYIRAAKSINNLYGFSSALAAAASDARHDGEITLGDSRDLSRHEQITINHNLGGFRILDVYTDVTVGDYIRPSAQSSAITSANVSNVWEANGNGILTMYNNSALQTPAASGRAAFGSIASDGSDNSIFTHAGTISATGTEVTQVNMPGLAVYGDLASDIKVGAIYPPSIIANGLQNARSIIWHVNSTNRDMYRAGNPQTVNNTLYGLLWADLRTSVNANQYTYLGLKDDRIVKVTNNSDQATQAFKTLAEAYTAIRNKSIGTYSAADGYTITFLSAYSISTAEWNSSTYTNLGIAENTPITYTGYDGAYASDQTPPPGSSIVTMPNATVSLNAATVFENITLQNVTHIYANCYKTKIGGGVAYKNASGNTSWVRIHGGGTVLSTRSTDLTICSGTYAGAAGGSASGGSETAAYANTQYNLTIHGGDFTGGVTATTTSVTLDSDGQPYLVSYIPYATTANVYASFISAAYVGGNPIDMSSTANLTIDDEGGYSFTAPGQIQGMAVSNSATSASGEWGTARFRQSARINIKIDTEKMVNFGSIVPLESANYGGDVVSGEVTVDINAPNSTIMLLAGGEGAGNADDAQSVKNADITLHNVDYVNSVIVSSYTSAANRVNILNGTYVCDLTVTGKVNAGSVNGFTRCYVTGPEAELNVLGAQTGSPGSRFSSTNLLPRNSNGKTVGRLTQAENPTYLTNNAARIATMRQMQSGLHIEDGATVNLHGMSGSGSTEAQNVFGLYIKGQGNHLNVVGNATATSATNSGVAGVLNVYGECKMDDETDVLILGQTPNGVARNASGERMVNIIQVAGQGQLRAADASAVGSYWDFAELQENREAVHFVASESSNVVRTDAFKNYVSVQGSIVVDNETLTDGTNQGFVYISPKGIDDSIDLIRVMPDPRDLSGNEFNENDLEYLLQTNNYRMYSSLEQAARGIASSDNTNARAYQIAFQSGQPYELTARDVDAVSQINATGRARVTDLYFSGKYTMPSQFVQPDGRYQAPAQSNMAIDTNGMSFRFSDNLTGNVYFDDLYLVGDTLGFNGANSNITIGSSTRNGIVSISSYAATTVTSDTTPYQEPDGKIYDNVTTTNTYMQVSGENLLSSGNAYYVDQVGYVWRKTLTVDKTTNDTWAIAGLNSRIRPIDTIEGVLYTRTDEVYIGDMPNVGLLLNSVDTVKKTFTVDGNREVRVTRGMNSPNGTFVLEGGRLSLRPANDTMSYTYSVGTLRSALPTGGEMTVYVPKRNTATNPLAVTTALPNDIIRLGINGLQGARPAPGDDLLTGNAIRAVDAAKYTESGAMLNHLEIDVQDGLAQLKPQAGPSAKDFIIQTSDVMLGGSLNTALIFSEAYADPRYYDANGNEVAGVTVTIGAGTTLTDKEREDPYDVVIVFSGAGVDPANNSVTVKAYVRDVVIILPCGCALGGTPFELTREEALGIIGMTVAERNQEIVKRGHVITMPELHLHGITYPVRADDPRISFMDLVDGNINSAMGKSFPINLTYICDREAADRHDLPIAATLVAKETPRLDANDFYIQSDQVYSDVAAKLFNEDIPQLAKARVIDAAGNVDDTATISIDAARTTLTNIPGEYKVTFISDGGKEKTVKATVADAIDPKPDMKDMEIRQPDDVHAGQTSSPFTAIDAETEKLIPNVDWSVCDMDGNVIPGAAMSDDGRLTLPAGFEGDIIVVATPTPGTAIADTYRPASTVITITPEGTPEPEEPEDPDNPDNPQPATDLNIRANNFNIGRVEHLEGKTQEQINQTAIELAQAVLWDADGELDSALIEVVTTLSASSQKGDIVDVTFKAERYNQTVEVTVKATVYDHVIINPDKSMIWANDFFYGIESGALTADEAKVLSAVGGKDTAGQPVAAAAIAVDTRMLADINDNIADKNKGPNNLRFSLPAEAGDAATTVIVTLKDHGTGPLYADDFLYGNNEVSLTSDIAKTRANVVLSDGGSLSEVTADAAQLAAINQARSQGHVGVMPLKFVYDKGGDGTVDDETTVNVTLYDVVVPPGPTGTIQIAANHFSIRTSILETLTSTSSINQTILTYSQAVWKDVVTGETGVPQVYDTTLMSSSTVDGSPYHATFTANGFETEKIGDTQIDIMVVAQNLTVTIPDLVQGETDTLEATDENGATVTDGTWHVEAVTPDGQQVPIYIDNQPHADGITLNPATGQITVGTDVPVGTDVTAEITRPNGDEGHGTATVKPGGSTGEPTEMVVTGDKPLMPGETTTYTAADPDTGTPVADITWSATATTPAGGAVPVSTTTPSEDGIYVNPNTGEVTVGANVPIGTVVEVTATPDDLAAYKPTTVKDEVQPNNVPVVAGVVVRKPNEEILPGGSYPFKAYDSETGEDITDACDWIINVWDDVANAWVVAPDTGADALTVDDDGMVHVGAGVAPGTSIQVTAENKATHKKGSETAEVGTPTPTPGTDLVVTGPDQPLEPGGEGNFTATDPETGLDVTEDVDWTVQVKDPDTGEWVDPDPGTITVTDGKVTVADAVEPGTEIKVTATDPTTGKTGSEEATIQPNREYADNYNLSIVKVIREGQTFDTADRVTANADGAYTSIVTGKWNNDSTVQYVIALQVRADASSPWQPATAEDFNRVSVMAQATAQFEAIGGWDTFFTSTTDLAVTYDHADASYGYGVFTVASEKSGIVNFTAQYAADGSTSAETPNTVIAVVPGDVNRNGELGASDGYSILGQATDPPSAFSSWRFADELMDVNRNGTIGTNDGILILQMSAGTVKPSN